MTCDVETAVQESVPLLEKKENPSKWSRSPIALVASIVILVIFCTAVLPGRLVLFLIGNHWFPPSHPSCALPPEMRWCRTQPGFHIACLHNDIVCDNICRWGFWEYPSTESLRFPTPPIGDVVDVGANVGWYSLLFADAGYTVHAFEAMPSNVQLLTASLCANPGLKDRIQVHSVALAAAPVGRCKVYSGQNNVGNGTLCCPGHECPAETNPYYKVREDSVMTTTLDAELSQLTAPIAFMKLDVEGYECQVIKGARSTFARIPAQFVLSEIWTTEVGCGASSYLSLLRELGYAVSLSDNTHGFSASKSDNATATSFDHIADVFAVRRQDV